MSFAEAARRLAGTAGVMLGWRPGEFWAATPAELAALFAAAIEAGGAAVEAPPDRQAIERLKERFPDG